MKCLTSTGLPNAEEAIIETGDGERVIVWHVPPQAEKPVVIYFHGNAEIVASRAARHRELTADGIGLIALSYRGYMGSTGSPTEEGLLRDAEAAYRFAAHPLRGRVGRDELRVLALDRAQLVQQRVVLVVTDLRVIEFVVAAGVVCELAT